MNKKIFLYLAIFGSISVQAQERWSLRQCIDYAIEHNISIRQTANAAEQSAVEVNTAKWARLPNLNASAGQSWNWGRTQTAIKNEDTVSGLSISLFIPDGFNWLDCHGAIGRCQSGKHS